MTDDARVEIRGSRTDWKDVQDALAALDGVDRAVVISREDRPGDKRLVAYLTGSADPIAVRAQLAERLPPYMVPEAVMVLDAMPLNGNGELDVHALPAPEIQDDPYREIEQTLARIFAEVLGVENVGVDDSFFDLGGDSLAAMQVVAAVNAALDAQLPLGSLFNAPTVSVLASRIGRDSGASKPLTGRDRPPAIPLSFGQSRLWFIGQLRGPSTVYNRAVALRLSGKLEADALGAALADVVNRHESLRTVFSAVEGVPRQLVRPAEGAEFG
jgi:acyl carrier protein